MVLGDTKINVIQCVIRMCSSTEYLADLPAIVPQGSIFYPKIKCMQKYNAFSIQMFLLKTFTKHV